MESEQLEFQNKAKKLILERRSEFLDYKNNNRKLAAVKALKDYIGGGLKECKEFLDLYFDDPNYFLVHDRQEKLLKLAKIPIIDAMIDNIQKTKTDTWVRILSRFNLDELLKLDEQLTRENKTELEMDS